MWVQSLSWGREDLLEEGMVTHSSILVWRIPWTEEPGRLQSMELQRVGHDGVTNVQPEQRWFLSVPPPCLCCHFGLLWIKEHQVYLGALRCFRSKDQSSLAVLPMDYSSPTVSPGPLKTCTMDSLLQWPTQTWSYHISLFLWKLLLHALPVSFSL